MTLQVDPVLIDHSNSQLNRRNSRVCMFRSALDWCLPFWGLDPTTESDEIHLPRAESVAVFLTAVVCLPDLDPGRALAAGYQPTKPPLPAKRRIGRASTASHCFPLQRLLVAERRVSGFQPLRRRWRRRCSSLGRTSEATSKTKQGVDLQIFGSRSNAGVYMQNDLGQCVNYSDRDCYSRSKWGVYLEKHEG
jgi:hypothetical protein